MDQNKITQKGFADVLIPYIRNITIDGPPSLHDGRGNFVNSSPEIVSITIEIPKNLKIDIDTIMNFFYDIEVNVYAMENLINFTGKFHNYQLGIYMFNIYTEYIKQTQCKNSSNGFSWSVCH